jgi:hypothetical protein
MFGSPSTAGLLPGSSATTAALLDTTQHANVSGFTIFPIIDVSAWAGVILTVTTLNPTGAAGTAFFQPTFTDARGTTIGAGGIPLGIQYPRPIGGGGPFIGFNAIYYRTLSRFMFATAAQDAAGGGDVRLQVFGTSMPGRFDGPYSVSVEGIVLGQIVGVAGSTAVSPFYCGPAKLYAADANGVGQVQAILTNSVTGAEYAGSAGNVTGIAARTTVDVWVPPFPSSLVFAGGGSGTVALIAA